MSTSTAYDRVALPGTPSGDVFVASWPLVDDPLRSRLTVVGIFAVAVVAGVVAGSWAMGAVSLLALQLAVWRLWVPVKIRLGQRDVVRTVLARSRRIMWHTIGSYEILSDGVLLLPDRERYPLAALRGLFVPFGEQRDAVLALVESRAGQRSPAIRSGVTRGSTTKTAPR